MALRDELKQLVGKKCWMKGSTLEIRKRSDAEIIEVTNDQVIIKNFLGDVSSIPIAAIASIHRKDLFG